MPNSRSFTSLLGVYPHLTGRDRRLLDLLDAHQVFTTGQIQRMFFHAERTCQLRLGELRGLGLVERFRFPRPGGGTHPWHWTLGHTGYRFQAAVHGKPEPTARICRQRVASLSANPNLAHLLAVNEFFVRLTAHERTHPHTRLTRWWSETTATAQFLKVRPDGHGLWSEDHTTVGFFVEADQASEPLGRVLAKLGSYARLAATDGPRYPVLFWLTSPTREEHLHTLLARHNAEHHDSTAAVPTATTTQDADPAEAVWLPATGGQRLALIDLPSSHGRDNAANPNFRDGALYLGDETPPT